MTIETDVAGVLRHDPVGRIAYSIARFGVNRTQMESVARAMETGAIKVAIQEPGENMEAGYTSLWSQTLAPGQKSITGRPVQAARERGLTLTHDLLPHAGHCCAQACRGIRSHASGLLEIRPPGWYKARPGNPRRRSPQS